VSTFATTRVALSTVIEPEMCGTYMDCILWHCTLRVCACRHLACVRVALCAISKPSGTVSTRCLQIVVLCARPSGCEAVACHSISQAYSKGLAGGFSSGQIPCPAFQAACSHDSGTIVTDFCCLAGQRNVCRRSCAGVSSGIGAENHTTNPVLHGSTATDSWSLCPTPFFTHSVSHMGLWLQASRPAAVVTSTRSQLTPFPPPRPCLHLTVS
jgi:hypothetical protein